MRDDKALICALRVQIRDARTKNDVEISVKDTEKALQQFVCLQHIEYLKLECGPKTGRCPM